MRSIASNPSKHNPKIPTVVTDTMRWKAKKLTCTNGSVWIVRDTWHPHDYRGSTYTNELAATALAAELNEAENRAAAALEVAE
jgi:hypothetical protein